VRKVDEDDDREWRNKRGERKENNNRENRGKTMRERKKER